MLRAACVALLAIVLTACGGGGGGESSSPQLPPSPPTVRTAPLHVGYFGLDGDQIRETADHVSFVMTPDWGDEWWATPGYDADRIGQIIAQMQAAKARGVKEAWIMMGFLVFTAQQNAGCPQSRYTVRPDAIPRLRAFRAQLQALDLDSMVTLLYPVDEPELHCLADEPLSQLVSAIKMEGLHESARAIITRWRMPPLSWCWYSSRRCLGALICTLMSISRARSRASLRPTFR